MNKRFLSRVVSSLQSQVNNSKLRMTEKPKIVIIGAGAAGLAAAIRLIGSGLDNIKILEAEKRIGGRLYSTDFDGVRVDLGAQWCHGEKGNIVYEKVKDLKLLGEPYSADYSTFNFYTSDGRDIDKDLLDRLTGFCWESVEDLETDNDNNNKTFKEGFFKSFDKCSKNLLLSHPEYKPISDMVADFFHKLMLCYEAAESWDKCAANGAFTKCEGQWFLHWKDNGFQTIIDVMMDDISKDKQDILQKNILLEKVVNKIIWKNEQESIKIDCADGSSFTADHVIITVSVDVLKNFVKNGVFVPNLSSVKVNQIQAIPLGTANKILLKFESKWWPDTIKDFTFLWTAEDKKSLANEFPEGPSQNSRSWLQDIVGFYTVDNHPNILLGWVVGPMAKDIELISDELVIKGCMFLLRKFLGKSFKIPEPNVLRSKWGTNPHFCGSWSYTSLEMVKNSIKNEDLAQSVCNNEQVPVLLFAGEATHAQYMSTVHGAIETGYREASKLLNLYNLPQNNKIDDNNSNYST